MWRGSREGGREGVMERGRERERYEDSSICVYFLVESLICLLLTDSSAALTAPSPGFNVNLYFKIIALKIS